MPKVRKREVVVSWVAVATWRVSRFKFTDPNVTTKIASDVAGKVVGKMEGKVGSEIAGRLEARLEAIS